jgi:hypothetical protein
LLSRLGVFERFEFTPFVRFGVDRIAAIAAADDRGLAHE